MSPEALNDGVDEVSLIRTRDDLKENALEWSKGCSTFCLSRPEDKGSLRLALAVGRKVLVLRWRHPEEWYSLTDDTAAGFEFAAELYASDGPVTSLTLLGSRREDTDQYCRVIVGTRHHFEVLEGGGGGGGGGRGYLRGNGGASFKLMTFPHGSDGAVSAIQIQEEEQEDSVEVFLTYNCSSHLQRVCTNAEHTNVMEWDQLPRQVVCAFPYILAVTSDAIEFRSAVNGALLQTMCLPEIRLISAKEDLYFSSTRQPASTRKVAPMKQGSFRFIYKIPWYLLVSGGSTGGNGSSGESTPQQQTHMFFPGVGGNLQVNHLRKRASSFGQTTAQRTRRPLPQTAAGATAAATTVSKLKDKPGLSKDSTNL